MQRELTQSGTLLDSQGRLTQVGWSRFPQLDCNLERVAFYSFPLSLFQPCASNAGTITPCSRPTVFSPRRLPTWDMQAIFLSTPSILTQELHEEGLVIPFSQGITLPRNSAEGISHFEDSRARLDFRVTPTGRKVSVAWPAFDQGKGISAELLLQCPPTHESMTIVIPIGQKRFYYNRKINCLPAEGFIQLAVRNARNCAQTNHWVRSIGDAGCGNIRVFGTGPAPLDSCPMVAWLD